MHEGHGSLREAEQGSPRASDPHRQQLAQAVLEGLHRLELQGSDLDPALRQEPVGR